MSSSKNNCCKGSEILIFPCSGASNTGEMSDRAARMLSKDGAGKMFCLAAIGAKLESFINAAKEAEKILVLDGCQVNCAKKTLEEAGVNSVLHIQITDLGIEKGKSPVNDENIGVVVKEGKKLLKS